MRYFPLLLVALLLDTSNGFNMECSISTSGYGNLAALEHCATSNLVITSPNQVVTSINGQDASFYSSQNEKWAIYMNNINFMPIGLDKFFPNLVGITVDNSKMTSIKQSDMKPFTKLREFHWYHSELQELESNLFEFNPDLERIVLINNSKLRSVGFNIFENLSKLKSMRFDDNNCISKLHVSRIPAFIIELAEKCPPSAAMVTTTERPQKMPAPTSAMTRNHLTTTERAPQIVPDKLAELETEINDLKLRLTEMEAKYKSCDGNLDAALLNLSMLKKKENHEATEPRIDFICGVNNGSHCEAQQLKVPLEGLSITQIKTKTGEIFDAAQIKKLTVANQETLFLPNNLAHHFPQLQDLIVTNSGLYELDETNFQGFDGLMSLALDHNKLQNIHSKTFHQLKNLHLLDLSFNKLQRGDNGLFLGLAKLQQLKLNNNFIQSVKNNDFDGLVALKQLSLENNKLKFMTSNILSQFSELSSADLTNNDCIDKKFPRDTKEEIEKTIVDNCTAPVELKCHFEDDQIHLDETTFISGYTCKAQDLQIEQPGVKISRAESLQPADYDKATVFVVLEQPILFLPLNLAKLIPNLQKIVIDRTKLSKIQKSDFKGFTKLTMLVLRNNDISSIDAGAFDDIPQLEYLNIANNKISTLPSNLFVPLIHLKTFILSHNNLTRFTADLLPKRNALEQFRVDHNKLEMIESKIFRSLGKAKIVDLRVNECIDMMVDKSTNGGNTFGDLYAEVDMKCHDDD